MKITCCLLLFLSLSACSLVPKKIPLEKVQVKNATLLTEWKLSGRVSIKTKDDSNVINILWLQKHDDINLRLYGTFGKTYARLIRENGFATLTVEDKTYTDTDAQYLLWKVLGWNLPLNEMIFWVKGVPQANQSSPDETEHDIERDQQGQLVSFNYGNWQAQYSRYKQFNHYRLPTRFKITHADISLRFSIQKWLTLGEN